MKIFTPPPVPVPEPDPFEKFAEFRTIDGWGFHLEEAGVPPQDDIWRIIVHKDTEDYGIRILVTRQDLELFAELFALLGAGENPGPIPS